MGEKTEKKGGGRKRGKQKGEKEQKKEETRGKRLTGTFSFGTFTSSFGILPLLALFEASHLASDHRLGGCCAALAHIMRHVHFLVFSFRRLLLCRSTFSEGTLL